MSETTLAYGSPRGLGGWLVFVGIGLCLAPIRAANFMLGAYPPIFSDGTWQALTTPGGEAYHPLWGPLIVFELACSGLLFLASLLMLALFFRRSRLFPRLYIAVAFSSLVFVVVDAWLATFVLPDEPAFDADSVRELIGPLIAVFIWVPYMLMSKRVANTFVNPVTPRHGDAAR
jgi:hypothetical protein